MKDASQILTEILSERKASNPSYSLRAFARDLGVSAPQLSNVMNGHRGLSPEVAKAISDMLSLDPRQKEIFTSSLKAKFSPSKAERVVAKTKLEDLTTDVETKYLALIELIKISKKKTNPESWFAEKLGIPEIEVSLSLGRLERLELIQKISKGYQVNQDTVFAEKGAPTEAVKHFHRQLLEKSIQAMAFQGPQERYGYSAAMPIKVKSVDRAKNMIQKFRSDFAKEISDHEGGEEIYGLCLQFFRLTQKNTEKKNGN